MPQALIRTFEHYADAQQAREALLADGFDGRVEFSVRDDEAGPVEGNFAVGNGRTTPAGDPNVREPLTRAGDDLYHHNFHHVEHRGLHLLVVQAETGDEQQRACAILDRYGAIDIDRLTAGRGGNG